MKARLITTVLLFFSLRIFVFAQGQTSDLFTQAQKKFNSGDYAAALILDIKALEKAQKENNCLFEAYATHQVGRMHYYLRDRRLALGWMFKANALADNCEGADSIVHRTLHNIGSLYQEMGIPDSAFLFYNKAKVLLDKTQNWAELSTLYGVLGELCNRVSRDPKESLEYISLCEKYARLSKDTNKLAFAYMKRGFLSYRTNQIVKAKLEFDTARQFYKQIGQVEGEMYALNGIGLSQGKLLDTLCVNTYLNLLRMKDSVFKAETANKTAEYKTLYETEKANAENKELAKANQQKNMLLIGIILSSLAVLTILWFAYSRYKIKKESEFEKQKSQYKTLRYKEVVEAEEKERTRIARELHDGIGQVLSATRMNVSVVKSNDEQDEKFLKTSLDLLDRAVREIRTISHNLMPASLMEMGLTAALKEMADNVNSTRSFKLELEIVDDLQLPSVSEVTIYRVIQEVINNAIRHSQATKVTLTLGNKNNNCYAEIKDNGKGFDTAEIHKSKGIGWKNIFSRVELLNGSIDINSDPGAGTTVYIEFKNT